MRIPIAGGLTGTLAALALAQLAFASSHNPKGEFAQFAECPLDRKSITDCLYSVTNDGSVTIGQVTVPIKNPVILQGGFEGVGEGVSFFGAENGETLSNTPQPVPGGISGVAAPTGWPGSLQQWLGEQLADEGSTDVTATLELAGPATSIKLSTEQLLLEGGTALGLPVKIRLDSELLGSNCYIGSEEEPIELNLTTGTSGSLKGSPGKLTFPNGELTLSTINGGRFVNGAFAVPAASGCGGIYSVFIDPLVNSVLGLPLAPGTGKSTAVLKGKFQTGSASSVRESE